VITTGIFVRLFCRDFVHKWREGETSGDENFTRTFKPSPGERRNAGPANLENESTTKRSFELDKH